MKTFIAILTLTFSTIVAAESTVIYQQENYSNDNAVVNLEINKDLGRAWVNVTVSSFDSESSHNRDERVKIEGLFYDVSSKEVVLERDGQRIVCGTAYKPRFTIGSRLSVRNSDRCSFEVKKLKISVDDGFEIKKVPVLQVLMIVE